MPFVSFLALKKPNILVPLPAAVSRGDQILNANSFKKQGFSYVLEEEKLNADTLMQLFTKFTTIVILTKRRWPPAIKAMA